MITEYQNLAAVSFLSGSMLRGSFLHVAFLPHIFYYYQRSKIKIVSMAPKQNKFATGQVDRD